MALSQFCRHNRFISECPICSKGTVLDSARPAERRAASSQRTNSTGGVRRPTGSVVARPSRGPYASAGPYGSREVRLEKVPGGLRLASWLAGQLERSAPVLALDDLPALLGSAAEKELLGAKDADALRDALGLGGGDDLSDGCFATASAEQAPVAAAFGRSPGRSGELKDELRVESLDDGQVRIARWVLRPNRGWELQEAPVLLPAARFAQALADAAARGVLASGQPTV